MAETVGKIYSTALYELCCEQDRLKSVFDELTDVYQLLFKSGNADCSDLVKLLSSPLVSGGDKVSVLEGVFGGRLSTLALDFLCLISEKGRFDFLPEIYEGFRELYNDKMNILEVTAVTSVPLTAELRSRLVAKLEKTTGKSITLDERLDKSIIGGIIVKYGNTEIDQSVKTKLDELKAQIGGIIA